MLMNKEKMIKCLSESETQQVLEFIIRAQRWNDVKECLKGGYPATPYVLQLIVERGWAAQLSSFLKTEDFTVREKDLKSLIQWMMAFFEEEYFIKMCLDNKRFEKYLTFVNPKSLSVHMDAKKLVALNRWDFLVEKREWEVIIDNNREDLLPFGKSNLWLPVIIAKGKTEALFKRDLPYYVLEGLIKSAPDIKTALSCFVNGAHWEELYLVRSEFAPSIDILKILSENKQWKILYENQEFKELMAAGRYDELIAGKHWFTLCCKGKYEYVDWENYFQQSLSSPADRKSMLDFAVKAGKSDFLRKKGYYFLALKTKLNKKAGD